jgi:DNA (cytosine-5)-methyltransferase 1
MSNKKAIHAVDLFCGAGGTSSGLYQACHSMGRNVDLLAINHWQTAIDTHAVNHPGARHICATLESIRPESVINNGHLNILVASPECTHHSVARGGRPVNDQLRASAWLILRWLESLRVDNLLIENVQEFQNWGPIGSNGRPLKSRRGETFQAFIAALRSFGYSVEYNVLNAADYGDPTTRRRLFILARRAGKKIKWPEPTHGDPDLFTDRKPYRTAREIIDWNIKGNPISERKRPLSPNTMRRILAGIKKFSGESFIVHMRGSSEAQIDGSARSVNEPIPTVTASGGGHFNLCEPFLVHLRGTKDCHINHSARSIDKPVRTLSANGQHVALCEPFVIHTNHEGGDRSHSINNPLPTITAAHRGEMALVEPFIIPIDHKGSREGGASSIDNPLSTITTKARHCLCEPFLVQYHGGKDAEKRTYPIDKPIPTLDTSNRFAICEPFLFHFRGQDDGRPLDEPVPALTTKDHLGLCEPFIVKYFGNGVGCHSINEPLDTITTKDRFGLVEVSGKYQIDIRFRMLQPHELAAAMSFDNYKFTGNRGDQVKQIGNAVPVKVARALCESLLSN